MKYPTRSCQQPLFLLTLLILACAAEAAPQSYQPTRPIEGKVVDAKSGKPLPNAVVSASFAIQRVEAESSNAGQAASRLLIVQTTTDDKGQFRLAPWEGGGYYRPRGWMLTPGGDPELRLYAEGYQHLVLRNLQTAVQPPQPVNGYDDEVRKHLWVKKTFRLAAIAATDEARADELRQWREEIEADYAGYLWRGAMTAINNQEPLLRLFHRLCKRLPDEAQPTVCLPPESELGKHLAHGEQQGPRPAKKAPQVIAVPPGIQMHSPAQRQQ